MAKRDVQQIKADAIIASSFEEVLYLDSDNIPLRDPTYLFDAELYAGTDKPHAIFWPDITKDHREFSLRFRTFVRIQLTDSPCQ